MAKISSKKRSMKIKQKLKRKAKLAKLREKYLKGKDSEQKEKILEKVFKLAPWLSKEEFLLSGKKEEKKD